MGAAPEIVLDFKGAQLTMKCARAVAEGDITIVGLGSDALPYEAPVCSPCRGIRSELIGAPDLTAPVRSTSPVYGLAESPAYEGLRAGAVGGRAVIVPQG